MVRPARFTDIPSIIGLIETCHEASKYKHADMDHAATKEILVRAIGSHKPEPAIGAMPVFVSGDDTLTGFILGSLQPLYMVLTEAVVTDHMWFVDRSAASPSDGRDLLDALHLWADRFPAPVRRVHMVNDAVMNPGVMGRMFNRDGYSLTGFIYEKEAGA